MAENPRRELPFRGILILIVIVVLGLILASPFTIGSSFISGAEFCPNNFQERTFSYSRIPGTRVRISSTRLGTAGTSCTKHITNHLTNSAEFSPTWQIVDVSQGPSSQTKGPRILLSYLKLKNADGSSIWDKWSFENNEHASILWPLVQSAAYRELYWCMPEIFQLAESNPTPKKLKRNLTIICINAAIQKSRSIQKSSDPKKATSASETISELKEWIRSLATDFQNDTEINDLISQFPG